MCKNVSATSKEILLQKLSEMPDMVVATAYIHAVNYTEYGVDVTQAWTTAVQQSSALSRAYERGYYDAMKQIHEEANYDREQQ